MKNFYTFFKHSPFLDLFELFCYNTSKKSLKQGGITIKLYLKQKVFSWGDRFTVKDSQGRDRYFAEGEVFSFGKKLHIYDSTHNEKAFIKQEMLTWMPRYNVFVGGHQVAQVVKKLGLLPQYAIDGPGWDVEGDFFAHEYQIHKSGRIIATIRKEWMSWGDSYELNISDGIDEVMALAVVLAIDAVIESSRNNRS